MKTTLSLALALLALVATTGCGPKDASSSGNTTAATAPQSGPQTIEITAGDDMKYSVTAIEAKPGEEITVILTNKGTQPKEVMGHNWILLKAGVDAAAFDAAATQAGVTKDFFPADKADEVLQHIPLLGPRKSGQVTFKVPTEPGSYTFLCSFPAHFQVGMKGTLTVK